MNDRPRLSDPYRATANKIANGDWQRSPTRDALGKLDFVDLEQRIYAALVEAGAVPRQAGVDRFTQYMTSL